MLNEDDVAEGICREDNIEDCAQYINKVFLYFEGAFSLVDVISEVDNEIHYQYSKNAAM